MKTAAELGITDEEHAALIATKDVLAAEQILFDMSVPCVLAYVTDDGEDEGEEDEGVTEQVSCRTHACIGGTMSILMGNGMTMPAIVTRRMGAEADDFVAQHNSLGSKFFPLFYGNISSSARPKDGIEAIDAFLAGNTLDPWLNSR